MRIGILSQWYDPEPVRTASILAQELRRRHHFVRVLTGFPNYPEGRLYDGYQITWRRDEVDSGIRLRRVAIFPSHSLSTLGRVANYGSFALSASLFGAGLFKDCESLWVHNSPPTVGLPTWIIRSRYRPRTVVHIMDLWPESLYASGFGDLLRRRTLLRRGLDRWLSLTYEAADSIACTSHSQVELLLQRGVPAAKLAYVPLWTDETIFHPIPRDEPLVSKLGLEGKMILLYAGTIGETQGLSPLIEVCASLRDAPNFHCVMAGSGIAEPRLRAQARERLLTNISFLGSWPPSEMNRLMSVGDIHLVSLRSDSLAAIAMPSKVQAILACGKPLIVAAEGDAASVVARSGAGWVCRPGDPKQLEQAIRAGLALDGQELRAMGRRGRQLYDAEFGLDIGVDRVERLLAGRRVP